MEVMNTNLWPVIGGFIFGAIPAFIAGMVIGKKKVNSVLDDIGSKIAIVGNQTGKQVADDLRRYIDRLK